jgi:hypothetical protein
METTKRPLYIVTFFILAAAIFGNCRSDKRIADKLYKERNYLLKEFKHKSIINRGKEFYQLSYYREQSVNTFFFERKGGILKLTNDSIQYPLNEIAAFTSVDIADSSTYSKALSNEIDRLIKVMDSLKINNVSSAFASAGIDMKIYFGDYKAMLYISNIDAVKNERWKNYIKSGIKLDENWYSVKDEL